MLERFVEFMKEVDYAAVAYWIGVLLFLWMIFAMFVGYIFDDIPWWTKAS